MIVCHLTSVHISFDTRIFYKECKSLAKQGYEVHLIAPHKKDEVVDGIRIHALPEKQGKLKRILFASVIILKKALSIDAALYHFHDPELIPAGLILRLLGRKVIYDVHEDYPETVPGKNILPNIFRKPSGWIIGIIERITAPLLSGVIVVTPAILKRFRSYTSRSYAVINYPITENYHKNSRSGSEDAVCYIGSIAENRGIYEMIEAVALASRKRPVKFILAGNFASDSLEKKLRGMPEFDNVDYRGFIDREESANVMAGVRAGLVVVHPEPRYQVAYPGKLFEYMSAGIPVIASDFPLWREIIEDARCGILVDPEKPSDIAEAILKILDNPAEAEVMGKRGREISQTNYRWDTEEKKLLDIYSGLLK